MMSLEATRYLWGRDRADIAFGCDDLGMLRAAALAGLGVALLPEDSCVEDVRCGALVHVLPHWSTPEGVVHFASAVPLSGHKGWSCAGSRARPFRSSAPTLAR
jgi:DNA-binding transcriptional LysR family regulator